MDLDIKKHNQRPKQLYQKDATATLIYNIMFTYSYP